MRRILKTGRLGLLAIVAAALLPAGSAAARAAPSGLFTLNAGQTMYLTHMNIDATNSVWVGYNLYSTSTGPNTDYVDQWASYGTNTSVSDTSYTNDTGATVYVRLFLQDSVNSATYLSDSSSYNTTGNWDHATTGHVKGKVIVSINDTAGNTTTEANSTPQLGSGSFNATVKIAKH